MSIQFSERPDLPFAIRQALQDPYYSDGLEEHFDLLPDDVRKRYKSCHLSVTTLPRSPRQRILFNRHSNKIVLDPLSGFWKLFGHVVHTIMEKYPQVGDLIEERLGFEVDGCYVHGAADLYSFSTETLQDYKITKANSMLYGLKFEYEAQLNVLAYIFRHHGFIVKNLQNVFLFRDWDPRMIKEGSLYPKEQIQVVNIPMWDDAKTLAYIKERVRLHISNDNVADDSLPHCTDQELWRKPERYAIHKIDPKTGHKALSTTGDGKLMRAKATVDSVAEAHAWMDHPKNMFDAKQKPIQYEYVVKPAVATRCNWCEIKEFCSQYRAEQKLIEADNEDSPPELP